MTEPQRAFLQTAQAGIRPVDERPAFRTQREPHRHPAPCTCWNNILDLVPFGGLRGKKCYDVLADLADLDAQTHLVVPGPSILIRQQHVDIFHWTTLPEYLDRGWGPTFALNWRITNAASLSNLVRTVHALGTGGRSAQLPHVVHKGRMRRKMWNALWLSGLTVISFLRA
ncbi:hypothetical protein BD311DRAFT_762461 [Dichomitus squalens]|uniref:Uncharacterized protein n=1 Tax=Dichomitus squalens TaxID=114155 RepID=A0A4Q9MK78_9APHY|nr:hypothetical protein BD311DRAFT_762461 [Dichomitus squalens]